MQSIDELIVIGAGNWGLTLASVFCKNLPTRVWAIDAALANHLNNNRRRAGDFFPHPIPESIVIEEKYTSPFDQERTLFIIAVPASQVRKVAAELGGHASKPVVIAVSKGFDAGRQCTMSELVKLEIPQAVVAVLTGPTIAGEVAQGKPTRAVMASDDLMHLVMIKKALQNDLIAFEMSRSPVHHEICGALKGLVAIAVGLAEGLDLGANAQGIIMSEGIREMGEVASFFEIPLTVAYGTSGAADLIATRMSPDSRNRRLGKYLSQGNSLTKALEMVGMTVEGVAMSQTIETLWAMDISIPLFHMVNAILLGKAGDLRGQLTALIKRI